MNYSVFYSFSIHIVLFGLIFISQKTFSNSKPKQYYIDFIGKTQVTTQGPESEIKTNQPKETEKADIEKKSEKIPIKPNIKTPKQVEDPDYLYTNVKNIKPSMALEESEIMKSESKNFNNSEPNTTQSSSGIRTDSDFPYPWYITKLRTKLYDSWQSRDITSKNLKAIVRFKIFSDGEISSIRIESSSGNRLFDQSVISTVAEIKRFDPLPSDFREDFLTIYVEFKTSD